MAERGTLYVVATPIGNLEDLTIRALRVLEGVDAVAAEDTRRTRTLLAHCGISKPLLSYYDAVESRRVPGLLRRLERGESIALISDAGTPVLSDPGHRLVIAAAEAGIPVVPVPGASALTAALAVAGLPCERFVFEGFLPARGAARARHLAALRGERRTLVFFEAPHRLARTLEALNETLGDRPAVMARELTKRYEEIRRGTLAELAVAVRAGGVRGEITLVVGGARAEKTPAVTEERLDAVITRILSGAAREGMSLRDIVDRATAESGGRRSDVYRRTLALRARKRNDG